MRRGWIRGELITGRLAIVSVARLRRVRNWFLLITALALATAVVSVRTLWDARLQLTTLQGSLHGTEAALDAAKSRNQMVSQAYADVLGEVLRLAEERDRTNAENGALTNSLRSIQQRIEFVNVSRGGVRTFSDYPLDSTSWVTPAALERFLEGSPLAGKGKLFFQAEIGTGINAVALLSLCIHEGAWGRSDIAREKNNCFGFGASDIDPHGQALRFNSFDESVPYVASYLVRNYLTQGGRYFRGNTLRAMNEFYASDPNWHGKVAGIWARAVRSIYAQPLELDEVDPEAATVFVRKLE